VGTTGDGGPRIPDVTTTSSPKPRRHWLQFSLRTLLVLMLVLGAGFASLAHEVQQARAQREAVKAIEQLGGSVRWK
jgi:cytoskeletal protein RodZ